jgi:hypothetical protein
MDRSTGTDHETALRMALGVLVDSMESKLTPYKDIEIILTDTPTVAFECITPEDPFTELCDRLFGKWVDVCHDNRESTWYFMWDGKIIETGFTTRREAKDALIDHLKLFGLTVPDDLMTCDDENPAQQKRLSTACIR